MMGLIYLFVVLLLSDREIIFDVLLSLVIVGVLMGFANGSAVTAKAKAQLTEALTLAKTVQMDQVVYHAETGRWPAMAAHPARVLSGESRIVRSLTAANGVFTFEFSDATGPLARRRLTFRRARRLDGARTASATWVCGYARPPAGYVAAGDNLTDVPKAMLPQACRV